MVLRSARTTATLPESTIATTVLPGASGGSEDLCRLLEVIRTGASSPGQTVRLLPIRTIANMVALTLGPFTVIRVTFQLWTAAICRAHRQTPHPGPLRLQR